MKNILTFFLLPLFIFSQDYSQYFQMNSNKNGKVYGKIKDSESSDFLEFATITIINPGLSKPIEGTISDSKGMFIIDSLSIDKYQLSVSFVGYESQLIDFELTNDEPIKNFKTIKLNPSSSLLEEAELIDEKPIYESSFEKIIYNPENDLSQSSSDALDVLRQTPLLSVDIDGNVSLRGSQNIKFLVNGKESSFLKGSKVSDVLQMIPSEQIKKVEVITSPTAKYDGEGDSGIVNIVTKQDKLKGFTGNVRTYNGTRVNRSGLSMSYGNDKFGISGGFGARYGWPREGRSTYYREVFDSLGILTNTLSSNGVSMGNWVSYNTYFDAYYEINPQLNLLSSFWYSGMRYTNENDLEYTINNISTAFFDDNYSSWQNTDNSDIEFEWTTDLVKKFLNNEDRELRFAFQLGGHIHDDLNEATQIGFEDFNRSNTNYGTGSSYTFQIDYVHPISSKVKLEVGSKYINRLHSADYQTLNNQYSPSEIINDLTDVFDYDQSVFASYISSNIELPKDFSLVIGFRYEGTETAGEYEVRSDVIEKNTYNNFLPSFVLSKKIGFAQTLKLSVTSRINRPDMHYINPNIVSLDSKNITIGNPYLDPEKTQQIELGFSNFMPGLMTNMSLYYKKKYDVIESFISLIGDTSVTNYYNIGENSAFGFDFFGNLKIRKKLNLRGWFDLSSYETVGRGSYQGISRNAFKYKFGLNATLELGNNYMIESRGWFNSPRQTVQGTVPSFSMFTFGIKKEFKNKRGSIGIGVVEPWSKYKSFKTELSGNNFNQTSDNQRLFRSININIKYQFGKLKFDPIKQKTNINNNDLMGGDGEGGGEF